MTYRSLTTAVLGCSCFDVQSSLLLLRIHCDHPSGLVPSAVLNVEMISRGGGRQWQTSAGSGTAAAGAGSADGESWASWIIRLGLTAIMLPFTLVQNLFAAPQRYEPLPQAPAAAGAARGAAGEAAQSRARPPRQERQVEFYNGMYFVAIEMLRCFGLEVRGRGCVATLTRDAIRGRRNRQRNCRNSAARRQWAVILFLLLSFTDDL